MADTVAAAPAAESPHQLEGTGSPVARAPSALEGSPVARAASVSEGSPAARAPSASELFYVSQGRSLKALIILCEGLQDETGAPLLDISLPPWSLVGKASTFKPNSSDLREEVLRRAALDSNFSVPPRPKGWTIGQCKQWLSEHKLTRDDDIEFITHTIDERRLVADMAVAEKQQESRSLSSSAANWIGKYPILRLIHALVDNDEIKRAFLMRHDLAGGRMAVENRNTAETRASSVWQLLASKWNDPLFLPVTVALPDVHSDFSFPIPLSHESISHMQTATAEKCEEKWQALNLQLNRIITKWERSGQGDGGFFAGSDGNFHEYENLSDEERDFENEMISDENCFGSTRNCSRLALDQRKNFIDGKCTYLLYMWEMLERHDLLSSSIQRLNDDASSANGNFGVPSVIQRKRSVDDDLSINSSKGSSKKSKTNDIGMLSASIQKHGESLIEVAKIAALQQEMDRVQAREESILSRINSLRDTKRNLIIRLASEEGAHDVRVKNAIVEEVEMIEQEIMENMAVLKNRDSTPQKSNRSPK